MCLCISKLRFMIWVGFKQFGRMEKRSILLQTERFFYEEEKNNKSDKNEQKFNEVKLESGQFFKFLHFLFSTF